MSELKIEYVDISLLKPAEYNPRKMSEDQKRKLKQNIITFGFVDPVIANKHKLRENIIIGGHHRIEIAKELFYTQVPVVYVDVDEQQEKLLNMSLNRISGEWDDNKLIDILKELDDTTADLTLTGFTDREIANLLDDKPINDIPDVPDIENVRVKLGDIWQCGNHRISCGDSLDKLTVSKLMEEKKADMVFTDPPYGISYRGGGTDRKNWKMIESDNLPKEDNILFCQRFINIIKEFGKETVSCYICYAPKNIHHLLEAMDRENFYYSVPIIWIKERTTMSWIRYHPQHEIIVPSGEGIKTSLNDEQETILFSGEGAKPTGKKSVWYGPKNESTVWKIQTENIKYKHPTVKPVLLIERALLNSSEKDNIILDIFLGSGSTLLACEKNMRICYGMEIDPYYVDIAITRWEQYTGQKAQLIHRISPEIP